MQPPPYGYEERRGGDMGFGDRSEYGPPKKHGEFDGYGPPKHSDGFVGYGPPKEEYGRYRGNEGGHFERQSGGGGDYDGHGGYESGNLQCYQCAYSPSKVTYKTVKIPV